GGSALGTYLLLRTMKSKVDPLSEDNVITFSVSPLVGLPISGANRLSINTKSPLTGGIADSQSGGFFAAHLKSNGWDSIVVKGCSPKPVYLYIDGDHVELKDATSLWGKVTAEVERAIKDELRDNHVEIAQIGPAGEKKVRFACVINMANRANGRNGTGAVMGSKNLKAIVVKRKAPQRPSMAMVLSRW
ncbi:aldehyde ferredoxin oxidoreductase N-terminal domain-containing protein, partial [Acetomicrobium hydrogeniformans]|uniref:aldehyde ferredoxin oxidoreductase N-terminal domain-containing protein n=1 Tax=Acetomicrobium hydrogeniformans TaxID=649746 RepID=UPI0023539DD4